MKILLRLMSLLFLCLSSIIYGQSLYKLPDFTESSEATYLYTTDLRKGLKNKDLSETECLTYIVYGESRGEPDLGQVAVAFVVKNRADKWHKTLCQVARQPGEFEARITRLYGPTDREAWQHALNIAFFLNERGGYDTVVSPVGDAIYFNSLSSAEQAVMGPNRKSRFRGKIGHHYFYGVKNDRFKS